jgi:hypothetical protein
MTRFRVLGFDVGLQDLWIRHVILLSLHHMYANIQSFSLSRTYSFRPCLPRARRTHFGHLLQLPPLRLMLSTHPRTLHRDMPPLLQLPLLFFPCTPCTPMLPSLRPILSTSRHHLRLVSPALASSHRSTLALMNTSHSPSLNLPS